LKQEKFFLQILKLSGQDNSLYYFDKEDAEGHYDKNGKSVQKALMKTPINGARLSSSFGMRKHPIDGFNKMHRGTDFAAPNRNTHHGFWKWYNPKSWLVWRWWKLY
jgi:murein DD-endopeptidase MepM/ murein hydrolase activator NlpD